MIFLHKYIKEFYEELKSPEPFNYIVSVYYDDNNPDELVKKFVLNLKQEAIFENAHSNYAQALVYDRN